MGILVVTWIVAGLLVGGYIWFMVWRIRVDRRKKSEKAAAPQSAEAANAARLDRILQKDVWPPTPVESVAVSSNSPPADTPGDVPGGPTSDVAEPGDAAIAPEPAVAAAMAAATTTAAPAGNSDDTGPNVTESLAGIHLPNDLVPLTTMADRPGIDDRVAFWTNAARADDVGQGFADELERLGYNVTWVESRMLAAQRDAVRLIAVVHPDADKAIIDTRQAFSSLPENAVAVEVWRQPY